MSKRKTDENATRKSRAKGPETPASEGNGSEPKTDAPVASKEKGRKPKKAKKQEKPPKEDLVVFAFRLKPEERDLIHKAAGAAKASRFVRALAVAASRGDEKAVVDIVGAVKAAS